MRNLVTFLIILSLFYTVAPGCKKSQNASFPYNYISRMGNKRYWHRTDYGTNWSGYSFSIVTTDTFALVINGLTVEINDTSFHDLFGCFSTLFTYNPGSSSDTGAKYLAFTNGSDAEVLYYYVADSIIIAGTCLSLHGEQTVHIKTP